MEYYNSKSADRNMVIIEIDELFFNSKINERLLKVLFRGWIHKKN